jgi:transposase
MRDSYGTSLVPHFILRGQDDGNIIPLPDHHSHELIIPANIRLIQQPAYSPEVNPIEHLWEELREKYFLNRLFSSLDRLTDQLCRALDELTDDKVRLTSLMSFPHLKVSV